MTARQSSSEGILPSQDIRHFIDTGIIRYTREIAEDQIQPASIDLRLWHEAYRVRASFLPGKSTTLIHKATANGMLDRKIEISDPTLLEPNVVYIIPLMESLALPPDIYGIANPKSTTGRLDIFTRLITEPGDEFERIRKGYSGSLYVEVVSRTFPIVVKAGMKLNQLRFGRGRFAPAGDARLRELAQDDRLLDADEDGSEQEPKIDRGMRITVDLQGNGSEIVAYRANKCAPPIDLSKIDHYNRDDYWTPIYRNSKRHHILEPGEFYILASKQRVRVPPDLAAELLPYDPATGEFRVHYAGFFDPGFGYGAHGEVPGTRVVLEVRANELPVLLEDDQFVGRVHYYNMAGTPDKVYGGSIGSSYQQQGLALSKQFRRDQQYISGSAASPTIKAKTNSETASQQGVTTPQDVEADDTDSLLKLAFPDSKAEYRINAKNL